MYNSLNEETSALTNSHISLESLEERNSRRKAKVASAVAILFLVVVALVGVSTTQTNAPSQQSTSTYLEAQDDAVMEVLPPVLTDTAVQGVVSGGYMTHSNFSWETGTNAGIVGYFEMTTEEQWDFEYFDETQYAGGLYYKIIHSHEDPKKHWLTMDGKASANGENYNPSVLQNAGGQQDKEGFNRWILTPNADGSSPIAGTPQRGVEYYLVNKLRGRCLAINAGLHNLDPKKNLQAPKTLSDSVMSYNKDAGQFPDACKIVLVDASNAKPAGNTHGNGAHGFWRWLW